MKSRLYFFRAAATCSLAFAFAAQLYASEPQAFIRGIRPLGMGGAFVAIADDQNAIFYNPAGLTQRQGSQFTLFEIPMSISSDLLQFYDFYNKRKDELENFDDLSNQAKTDLLNEINDTVIKYRPALRTGFPNTSYLKNSRLLNWGFGLFSQADIGFQFNRSLIIPNISLWGNVDVIGAVPLAYRFNELPYIPGALSVGTTLKYINRAKVEELNKSVLEFEEFEPQLQMGRGFGADIGGIYHLNDRWNFGLQITDFGGTSLAFEEVKAEESGETDRPSFTGMIKPQWNAGAAYCPSRIYYWPGRSIPTNNRLLLAADVRDVVSTNERLLEATFWKKLHLGAEYRFSVLSLRGGLNSGYPTFGAGARIPYIGLRADYAFWGEELGRYAGQLPSWNHQITLALSWGDSKGRAYGKDAKAAKSAAPVAEPAPVKAEASSETPVPPVNTPAPVIPAAESPASTAVETAAPATAVPAESVPAVPAAAPSAASAETPAVTTPAAEPPAQAETPPTEVKTETPVQAPASSPAEAVK